MIIQRQLSPPKPLPKQPIRTPPYHKFCVYRNFADKLQRWQELPARQACRIAEGRALAAAPDYVPFVTFCHLVTAAVQTACACVVTAAAATEENQDQNNPQTGVSSLRTSAHLALHLLFSVHFIICDRRFLVPVENKKTPARVFLFGKEHRGRFSVLFTQEFPIIRTGGDHISFA